MISLRACSILVPHLRCVNCRGMSTSSFLYKDIDRQIVAKQYWVQNGDWQPLTASLSTSYDTSTMKRIRVVLCVLLGVLILGISALGNDLPPEKVERLRTGMTLFGAALGLGIGPFLNPSPEGTPLSNLLLISCPAAAAATSTGALAGRWVAEVTLTKEPSLLFSPLLGAGLGAVATAFVGGVSFSLAFAIAIPTLDVREGYWGPFNYPQAVGMSFLAGAFWGGLLGVPIGVVTVPIISVYMGF